MLPDEVREAVERMCTPLDESRLSGTTAQEDARCMALIRAHLLAREAEVERLQNIADGNAELYQHELLRTEKAEALLREALGQVLSNIGFMAMHNVTDGSIESAKGTHSRITAHLSENSRG